jgi:hypothetical protein
MHCLAQRCIFHDFKLLVTGKKERNEFPMLFLQYFNFLKYIFCVNVSCYAA